MNYFINLFSPETYEIFSNSKQDISGFRLRQKNAAEKIKVGDHLVCYMTKLSRWIGILEVTSEAFIDSTPIFFDNDPFVVHFHVEPLVWLPKEKSIPIHDDAIWTNLSFTKSYDKKTSFWTGKLRSSLVALEKNDAKLLEKIIGEQKNNKTTFPIDEKEYEKLVTHKVKRTDKTISVSIPSDNDKGHEGSATTFISDIRESIQIQAKLAKIGDQMGMKVWIPKSDRSKIYSIWEGEPLQLLESLPLSYDETTLKTIEQIDILGQIQK